MRQWSSPTVFSRRVGQTTCPTTRHMYVGTTRSIALFHIRRRLIAVIVKRCSFIDPLAEIVTLLQPAATLSKIVGGAGRWRLRRTDAQQQPFYCVVLDGSCRFATASHEPISLVQGDFVLVPAVHDFTVSSSEPPSTGLSSHRITRTSVADAASAAARPAGPAPTTSTSQWAKRLA